MQLALLNLHSTVCESLCEMWAALCTFIQLFVLSLVLSLLPFPLPLRAFLGCCWMMKLARFLMKLYAPFWILSWRRSVRRSVNFYDVSRLWSYGDGICSSRSIDYRVVARFYALRNCYRKFFRCRLISVLKMKLIKLYNYIGMIVALHRHFMNRSGSRISFTHWWSSWWRERVSH